jgi:hypothetical protein
MRFMSIQSIHEIIADKQRDRYFAATPVRPGTYPSLFSRRPTSKGYVDEFGDRGSGSGRQRVAWAYASWAVPAMSSSRLTNGEPKRTRTLSTGCGQKRDNPGIGKHNKSAIRPTRVASVHSSPNAPHRCNFCVPVLVSVRSSSGEVDG